MEEIWEGVRKIQYPKRGYEKFFILVQGPEIFCPSKPQKSRGGGGEGEGLNLDQISFYCASIQILM